MSRTEIDRHQRPSASPSRRSARAVHARAVLVLIAALALAGCPARAPKPVATDAALPFDQAMQLIADNLSAQVQKTGLLDRVGSAIRTVEVPVVIDPFIDAQNGYAVTVGQRMQTAIGTRMRETVKNYTFLPLTAEGFNKSAVVMTGVVSFQDRANAPQGKAYRVSVSLTDTKTGVVAAQSSAWSGGSRPMNWWPPRAKW